MGLIFDPKQDVQEHTKEIRSGTTIPTQDIEKLNKEDVGFMNGLENNKCSNCMNFCKSIIGVHCCNKVRGTVKKETFCNEFNPSDSYRAKMNSESAKQKLGDS